MDPVSLGLLNPLDSRFPDPEVADQTFYLWQSERDVRHWQRSGVAAGRHLRYPDDADFKGYLGFVLKRSPDGIASSWPGHLFRVGDIRGLLRRSFHDGSDLGWCEGLTILEELPPTRSFGPGGEAAAAITARAASLSVDEVEALGEAARPFGPELPRRRVNHRFLMRSPESDIRDRFEQVVARVTFSQQGSPPRNVDPMDFYLSERWIDLGHRTDPGIGDGHLLWESDKCWPLDAFVKASWRYALLAFQDALRAALWADLIEADIFDWLNAPWAAGIAAIDASNASLATVPADG